MWDVEKNIGFFTLKIKIMGKNKQRNEKFGGCRLRLLRRAATPGLGVPQRIHPKIPSGICSSSGSTKRLLILTPGHPNTLGLGSGLGLGLGSGGCEGQGFERWNPTSLGIRVEAESHIPWSRSRGGIPHPSGQGILHPLGVGPRVNPESLRE